jgi:DNA-binding transcriptional MerR regulator
VKTTVKIGEVAQLSGVTVKTILHYHKLGLLAEPQRSPSGYRLYGAQELNQLQTIKHLKTLGLNLSQIKIVLKEDANHFSMEAVLESLEKELLAQKELLETRLAKISELLNSETKITADSAESTTMQMVINILGEEYESENSDAREQERQLYKVLDNYEWGMNHQEKLLQVAEYYADNPLEYQLLKSLDEKLAGIAHLPPETPEIDELARECVRILKCMPNYQELVDFSDRESSFESLLNEMLAEVLTPAQIKFCQLCEHYFS